MAKDKLGFRVFIDESGDEGFTFASPGEKNKSSCWFVITAVVVRVENEIEQVSVIDDIRTRLGKDRSFNIHFRELKHEQKALAASMVGKKRFRTVSVAIHKPSIAAPETFRERYRLYFYATRYLLERVSWLCRDNSAGNQKAEVIFSNRAGMKYQELIDYMGTLLKHYSNASKDIRIDWDVISCDRIRSEGHKAMKGLQVADIVASSTFAALHANNYGLTETGYLQRVAGITYKNRGTIDGYGIKFWPNGASKLPEAAGALQAIPATKRN